MNQSMKAAVVHAFGAPLRIEEVKTPLPGPGQILVKIEACGVCHTDLHAAEGDWPVKPSLPFIPGHEGVGYVAAVGRGVARVKEGDRVGVPWLYSACGGCEHCLSGWETLCESQQNTGYSINGGYAEYVLADPNYVGILPKGVDFLQIARRGDGVQGPQGYRRAARPVGGDLRHRRPRPRRRAVRQGHGPARGGYRCG
jgi:propanol-preferring alcohol dehydrogenase